MGLLIEDGKGRGYTAEVNRNNQLKISSAAYTIEHYINHQKGRAFTMSVEVSASADDACVIYIKNTSSIYDIVIEGMWIYVSGACEVYAKLNDDGTPTSTTNISPVNLNTSSGVSSEGDFYRGNNIGGLSGGDEIVRLKFTAETQTTYFNYDQDVILGNNGVHTIYVEPNGTNIIVSLPFNYHRTD